MKEEEVNFSSILVLPFHPLIGQAKAKEGEMGKGERWKRKKAGGSTM